MNTEQIWKEHPTLEVVYVTSDETAFYNENDAKNHAKGLENKSIEPVYNPAHLGAVDAEILEGNKSPELENLTVAQLKQFAKDNGFEVPEKGKKSEILDALEAQMTSQSKDSKQEFIDDETLLGSSFQPAEFKLNNGSTLSLGDVVRAAFVQSGLATNKDWNDLSDDDRESYIKSEVEKLDLETNNPQE